MTVISGKFGVVNGLSHVRNWSVDHSSTSERFKSSATEFGQFVNDGVKDWSGSFEGFGEGPPVTIWPGLTFTFEGYTAPTTGVYGNDGKVYTGTAIVDSLTLNWDWSAGASHTWSVAFSAASGGLVESDGIFDDTAVTIPDKMCNLAIKTGTGAGVDLPNVMSAALVFTANNQEFVNSTTACATHRTPGGFDWTLTVTQQDEKEYFSIDADLRFKIYTDATSFWLLEWAHLESITGLNVDRESEAILQRTYNFIMNGSDGAALGQVAHPDATVMWPEVSTPTGP
jgi:hypothetical protein